MNPVQWQRAKDLFHAALDRDPAGRGAWLAANCADDALRGEVQSLLSAHQQNPEFISNPAVAGLSLAACAPSGPSNVNRRIGPWLLLEPLASGGMGMVYRAVRADDEFQQQVAVKLIRDDRLIDDAPLRDDLVRRFRAERQVLAALDHPNIARLLDGGATDDGLPYLAMEYVDGLPIDKFCEQRRLSVSARLDLFLTVCDAVQYAHRNLIVHRDLKPANILVEEEGTKALRHEGTKGVERRDSSLRAGACPPRRLPSCLRAYPKLVDFGIAKLLDPLQSGAAPATITGRPALTPEYASPEQFTGRAVTTLTDVYSLGVVLYELLTGRLPYPVRGRAAHDAAKIVCEQEPEKPSTIVTRTRAGDPSDSSSHITLESPAQAAAGHASLRRQLAGDLDHILLMALRKEPERRYPSVEQFAADIHRHLAGLPVTARRGTWSYRTIKFVRRHAIGVVAAAGIVLSLVGGIVATTWQAGIAGRGQREARDQQVRAERAEREARVEARTAEQVSEFLVNLFQASDPHLTGPGVSDAAPDGPSRADVTARELLRRGATRVTAELGDQPEVQARLMTEIGAVCTNLGLYEDAEPLLRQSLEIRRRILGDDHPDLAITLTDLGELLARTGAHDESQRALHEALAIRRRHLPADDPKLARTLSCLAALAARLGRHEEAETLYREALDIYRARHDDQHAYVAAAVGNLATMLVQRGEHAQAEDLLRRSLDGLTALHGPDHPDVATASNNLAGVLYLLGHLDEALTLYEAALAAYRKQLDPDHPLIAESLSNLGLLFCQQGEYAQAEQMLRESLALRRQRFGDDHPQVAAALNALGPVLHATGRYAEAEPMFREALSICRAKLPADHIDTALALHNLASVMSAMGRLDEAEPLFHEALEIRRKLPPAGEHVTVPETLSSLAGLALSRGSLGSAEPLLRESLAIRRRRLGPDHPDTLSNLAHLASVVKMQGRLQEAEPIYREVLAAQQAALPPGHPDLAGTLTGLGDVLALTGRPADAEPLLIEALDIRRGLIPDHWATAHTSSVLGGCLLALERLDEAGPMLAESYARLRELRGDADPLRQAALERLVHFYEATGDTAQLAKLRGTANE